MGPRAIYLNAIANGNLKIDAEQNDAITEIERCYLELTKKSRLFSFHKPITGLYLWGSVGVGKSMLINILSECLGPSIAYRGHYHEWMASIQKDINRFSGHKDPIKTCAKNWAKKYKAIILDEFLVTNIADAMIMSIWLQEMKRNKVTLITTSNTEPKNLYRNGMGREKFLPAIKWLEENTKIINLRGEHDYRRQQNIVSSCYITPINNHTPSALREIFAAASAGISFSNKTIEIGGRPITVIDSSTNTLWIDFANLCGIPRSQLDYIEMSQKYSTIIISGLRKINPGEYNEALNLIQAIDVFYDAGIKIIVTASVAADEVYQSGRHAKDFLRTASRLKSL
jgi:cell division protein ZapE